ncbi:MAG: helix-turn-helix domain-containing protein [Gammaproteobacteria bacterium]
MTTQRTGVAEARPLDILGISEAEERAYRWLLTHYGATVPELTQALGLTPGKTQRLLDLIEGKGLATHAPERPRRYIPASPDIALKALSLRRQEELQCADGVIQELQEQAATQRATKQEQMVELITSHEAERQIIDQIARTAKQEVVILTRPPVRVTRLDVPHEQDQHHQHEAQARGVRFRSIVDAEFLALPGAVARVRADIKAAEEVRVFPYLPFKLILADHRIAIIPLSLEQRESPSLLVRSSALLDALYALFEILWERAVPILFTSEGTPESRDSESSLPEEVEDLISLMAAGLNDKKIAYELKISGSTLKRRISEVMKAFNASTRFQLGRLTAGPVSNRINDSK